MKLVAIMTIWPYFCGAAILGAAILVWALCRAAASVQEVRVNEETL